MTLTPLPVPNVTPPNWGQQLLDALAERYDRRHWARRVENRSGTGQGFTTVATTLPGMVLAIPATEFDVWINWSAYVGLGAGTTADSRGPLYTLLYELTTGVAVARDSDLSHKSLGINYVTTALDKHKGSYYAGPSDAPRVFALYAQVVKEAGTTLNGLVLNGVQAPTILEAVAA